MKKFILLAAIVSGVMFTGNAKAQVNVNINIGAQPVWGPVGYDHVDYYYLPDIDVYYNVPQKQYVYFDNGRWMFASALPYRYRNYDIYRGYKVVINEPRPYLHNNVYRVKYKNYKNNFGRQVIIRDSKEVKYKVAKGYKKQGKKENKGRGHDRGKR
ncbi:hypothetical protein [Foetidibacter luteolus]|uniref:hypothetical protein n=1 Tax=Foetidibacter luteolus TaxID=2608880 RepID=UPI00129B42F3|nr:hypothetical protein [Foetidibacter luteolus]